MKRSKRGVSQTRFTHCDVCQRPFTTKRSHTSTCSLKCRQRKRRALIAKAPAGQRKSRLSNVNLVRRVPVAAKVSKVDKHLKVKRRR